MENFSIVKFLQSMLTPAPEKREESEQTSTSEQPAQKQEKPPETPSVSNGQQAVVYFMEEHERRAKRVKK